MGQAKNNLVEGNIALHGERIFLPWILSIPYWPDHL